MPVTAKTKQCDREKGGCGATVSETTTKCLQCEGTKFTGKQKDLTVQEYSRRRGPRPQVALSNGGLNVGEGFDRRKVSLPIDCEGLKDSMVMGQMHCSVHHPDGFNITIAFLSSTMNLTDIASFNDVKTLNGV